jgi:hypothetical protein
VLLGSKPEAQGGKRTEEYSSIQPGGGGKRVGVGSRGQGGEMTQTMYAHVNK